MKPFRKHVAIAVDGGGIKGIIAARALSMLEDCLGKPIHDIFRLAAGTSTGSIISAGLASGLTAHQMFDLYTELGNTIFPKSLRSLLWPISRYRYPNEPLVSALNKVIGAKKMGDFWTANPPTDVVLTTFDLVDNHTRFVKPWKDEYKDWPVVRAVLASSSVPTCTGLPRTAPTPSWCSASRTADTSRSRPTSCSTRSAPRRPATRW